MKQVPSPSGRLVQPQLVRVVAEIAHERQHVFRFQLRALSESQQRGAFVLGRVDEGEDVAVLADEKAPAPGLAACPSRAALLRVSAVAIGAFWLMMQTHEADVPSRLSTPGLGRDVCTSRPTY